MAPTTPNEKKRKRNTVVKKVEGANSRNATFSKRKLGLFKKLTELSILCGAETALIIASPTGNKISICGYPSADAVIRRFLARAPPLVATGNMKQFMHKLETLMAEYQAVEEKLKEEKKKLHDIKEEQNRFPDGVFPSWWETPISNMGVDGLQLFKQRLENLKLNLVMQQVSNNNPPLQPQPLSVVPPPPSPSTNSPVSDDGYGWQQVQDENIGSDSASTSTSSDSTIIEES